MRLDLYLKSARIIKRRIVAKELIEKGNCYINNKQAKASSDVKINDRIILDLPLVKLEVLVSKLDNKNNCEYEVIKKEVKSI